MLENQQKKAYNFSTSIVCRKKNRVRLIKNTLAMLKLNTNLKVKKFTFFNQKSFE